LLLLLQMSGHLHRESYLFPSSHGADLVSYLAVIVFGKFILTLCKYLILSQGLRLTVQSLHSTA